MSKRQEIARDVHTRLIAAEVCIDEALAATSDLNSFLPRARQAAMLAVEAGHEVMEEVAEACNQLLKSRAAMVRAHRKLSTLAEELSLPPSMFGGAYGKPSAAAAPFIGHRQAA